MFKLTMETVNASFEDPQEIPNILRDVAERISRGRTEGAVFDANGNRVGTFKGAGTDDLD